MNKVKLFSADEADANNMEVALTEKLATWLEENPQTEVVNCQTALAYDSDECSLYGIMTLVYRESSAS